MNLAQFVVFVVFLFFLKQHQNIRPVQQMVPVYILHLCKSNQNHASSRWLHSHMQRKSHFGLIFSRNFKAKVKRLPTMLLEVYTVKKKNKKGFCGKTKIRNEKCYPKPENWFGICWRGLFTPFFLQVNETK